MIVVIPGDIKEEKVCELISSTIGVIINPNALESCHGFPYENNDKISVNISRREDTE